MIRLLAYAMPGCPIYEISEAVSDFHDVDLFTLERHGEDQGYWSDKIPSFHLDTGDMTSGSASEHMARDPLLLEKDEE